jgi:uncharacterized membrane protein YeaQ/YmgE (transglycosylase-associated protein family)
MSIILTIILGAIIGWAASRVMGRDENIFMDIIIGIAGSFIGSFLSEFTTGSDRSYLSFSLSGLIWSLLGAIVLMGIIKAIGRPTRHHA